MHVLYYVQCYSGSTVPACFDQTAAVKRGQRLRLAATLRQPKFRRALVNAYKRIHAQTQTRKSYCVHRRPHTAPYSAQGTAYCACSIPLYSSQATPKLESHGLHESQLLLISDLPTSCCTNRPLDSRQRRAAPSSAQPSCSTLLDAARGGQSRTKTGCFVRLALLLDSRLGALSPPHSRL